MNLPALFFRFWFIEAPYGIFSYFFSLNSTIVQLLSLPILIKTYFKPWKNEYRQGLVGFSIGMGMFIKTFVILADLIILTILFTIELAIICGFIFWPVGTILFLIY
ncbi:MAG: hypothetical protein M1450_03055 [Patescibacteria group bacterium]|nr:hypothetical protein [Patescibacteria group bacterium]